MSMEFPLGVLDGRGRLQSVIVREARQSGSEACRVGKAQRAHHLAARSVMDGGHVASLLCPPYSSEYDFAISRRIASEVCILVCPPELRGRREDRVLSAPAVSREICAKQNCTRAYRAARTLRPSLRNGFTAYFVLFPENGSFASVARASYRKLSASTATPEPHDFTVRIRRVRLSHLPRPPHLTARP